ncbi:leucine-rich repeat domain-containing protein [Myxococcaceae bacterium GXIMD 01537]
MKHGAWCAAALVALTGCKPAPEAPRGDTPAASAALAPVPESLPADVLARQPVFTSLEEALRAPDKAFRLDLSAHPGAPKLAALSPEVGRLVRLQELTVAGQGLSALPAELWHLRGLQHLDLSGNHLRALPEEVGQLRRLETLALARNELQRFPGAIVALPVLRTLSLEENPFQVSLALGQVKTLERVDVGEEQGDLEALREALPQVRWEVHGAGGPPVPAASSEELEVAQPEPQEETAEAPRPRSR